MNLFMDVFLNICTLLSGYLALWKLLDKREMPNRFLWNCAKGAMCCWRHFCRRW